ncbi:MAG: signal peptidase I [Bacteroidetes bacterium]|nr:signal peptidase I [Bacteroidota bacterium]MCL5267778.1 signal peptidase I [Bacteroidota bacterium]
MQSSQDRSNGPSRSGRKARSKHDTAAGVERQTGERSARKTKEITLLKRISSMGASFVAPVTFALLLITFVVQGYGVPTESMENTVMTGDFLFVNKFIYGARPPQYIPLTRIPIPYFRLPGLRLPHRGDIIVFDWPGDRDEVKTVLDTDYVKRCIGLPGDTVSIVNRIVYVNGNRIPFPPDVKFDTYNILPKGYADPMIFPEGSGFNADNYGPIVVPKKGEVIRLTPGNFLKWKIFIEREGHTCDLRGSTVYVDNKPAMDYKVEGNYYFMMGDNRENSLDSRYWGFVPFKDIVGEPMVVYWNWNQGIPIYDLPQKLASIKWDRIGIIPR